MPQLPVATLPAEYCRCTLHIFVCTARTPPPTLAPCSRSLFPSPDLFYISQGHQPQILLSNAEPDEFLERRDPASTGLPGSGCTAQSLAVTHTRPPCVCMCVTASTAKPDGRCLWTPGWRGMGSKRGTARGPAGSTRCQHVWVGTQPQSCSHDAVGCGWHYTYTMGVVPACTAA